MRLIEKRFFKIEDPIFASSIDCRDTLFRNDQGEFILYSAADGLGEKLLQFDVIAAHAWLNARPDEYGIAWANEITAPT
jgi:hypothetical protein